MNSYLNRINSYCEINSPASCMVVPPSYLFKFFLQVKESSTAATGSSTVSRQVEIMNSCMSNHTMNSVQYGFILLISIHVFIVLILHSTSSTAATGSSTVATGVHIMNLYT